jgi:hypothetical protein
MVLIGCSPMSTIARLPATSGVLAVEPTFLLYTKGLCMLLETSRVDVDGKE